jgi:Ca2+-binding RTX toxin-like protein
LIEWLELRDNLTGAVGVPTLVDRVQMGDLYVRGTESKDRIGFVPYTPTGVPAPTNVRLNFNAGVFVTYNPTRRIVSYGRAGDDQFTVDGLINSALLGVDFFGQEGNDTLAGGNGNDSLFGGIGNDRHLGGNGADYLGIDPLNVSDLGAGTDSFDGGTGDDIIRGGSGTDTLYGGTGNDWIDAGPDGDTADGGAGDDLVRGGAGADNLKGSTGNDIILGEAGTDKLYGGADRDILAGGMDADYVSGEDGDDIVIGGRTNYDTQDAAPFGASDTALLALMAEWGSANTFALRRSNMIAGVGPGSIYQLNTSTILNGDNARDTLLGSLGADWMFQATSGSAPDTVTSGAGDFVDLDNS